MSKRNHRDGTQKRRGATCRSDGVRSVKAFKAACAVAQRNERREVHTLLRRGDVEGLDRVKPLRLRADPWSYD